MCMCMCMCMRMCMCMYVYIYIYIYMYTYTVRTSRRRSAPVHPIPITRFRSFRTQPLENLSAAVKLPIKKKVSGQPNPWKKSCEGKYCDGNWV